MIRAQKVTGEADLGFVGEPTAIAEGVIAGFEKAGMIPVIAPIGVGRRAARTYSMQFRYGRRRGSPARRRRRGSCC